MSETRYLKKRGNRWWFQLAVPKHLQDKLHQKTIQESLNTSDLRQAKNDRWKSYAIWQDRFERAQNGSELTDNEISSALEAEYASSYEAFNDNFLKFSPIFDQLLEELEEDKHWPLNQINDNKLLGIPIPLYAKNTLVDMGIPVDEQKYDRGEDESVNKMTLAIINAQKAAIEAVRRGPNPPRNINGFNGSSSQTEMSVSAATELYIDERQRDELARLTEKTISQMKTSFRLFSYYVEDCPIDAIRRSDAAGFLDALGGLHKNYGRNRKARKLALSELLDRFPGPPFLSNKTLNRHQSALQGFFKWARKRQLIDGENPFADLSRQVPSISETTWLPFNIDELNHLFEALKFETRPKQHSFETALPWIMAIALYSGMRLAEITELDVENIGECGGIAYFDITSSKSEPGVRWVPIHSELRFIGLQDYIAGIESGPLFPGLKAGGPDQKLGYGVSREFNRHRQSRAVSRERVCFHSFRKCFVRALEMASVDRDRAAQVVGHERGFTFRVYNPDGVDMDMLRDVVEHVTYEGLEL